MSGKGNYRALGFMVAIRKFLKPVFGVCAVMILFVLTLSTATTSVPFITKKQYDFGETSAAYFKVVLESHDGYHDQIHFVCVSWDELQLMERNDQNEYVSRPRTSLNPFTHAPQNFVTARKTTLLIATVLLVFTGLLLLKQFWRPAPGIQHKISVVRASQKRQ